MGTSLISPATIFIFRSDNISSILVDSLNNLDAHVEKPSKLHQAMEEAIF